MFEFLYQVSEGRRITRHIMHVETQKRFMFDLYYTLGGMNYFSGRVEQRGYAASLQPLEETGREKLTSYTCAPAEGFMMVVEPTNRFSLTRFTKLAEETLRIDSDVFDTMMSNFYPEIVETVST